MVTYALGIVRVAQSTLQGQGGTVDTVAASLSTPIGVTKDASASYSDTDLVEAASWFAAALKSTMAAISTLPAEDRS